MHPDTSPSPSAASTEPVTPASSEPASDLAQAQRAALQAYARLPWRGGLALLGLVLLGAGLQWWQPTPHGLLWALTPLGMALVLLLDGRKWPWGALIGTVGVLLLGWAAVQNQISTEVFARRVVLGAWVAICAWALLLRALRAQHELLRRWEPLRPEARPEVASDGPTAHWRAAVLAQAQQDERSLTLQFIAPAAVLVLTSNISSIFYPDQGMVVLNILLVRVALSLFIIAVLLHRRVSGGMTLAFTATCLLGLTTNAVVRGETVLGFCVAAPVFLMPLLPRVWRWPLVLAVLLCLATSWGVHRYDPMQALIFALATAVCAALTWQLAALRERMQALVAQLDASLPPQAGAPQREDGVGLTATTASTRANRLGWITFAVTGSVCLMAQAVFVRDHWRDLHEKSRNTAHEKALLLRNLLNDAGQAAIALGTVIATADQNHQHPDSQQEFDALAAPLLQSFQGVTALQYAPQGVVRWTAPLAGHESVQGYDLLAPLNRRPETSLALETGQLVMVGPQALRQGGLGVIGRYPVYRQPGQADSFLGFAHALILLPQGVAAAQLHELHRLGLEYQLWRKHPESGQPQLILPMQPGAPIWPADEAETVELRLHNIQWFISVRPIQGFMPSQHWLLWSQLALLLSVTLALYVRQTLLLRQAASERDDMRQQVQQLALERQLLDVQQTQERIDDLLPLGIYRFHFDPQGQVVADHLSPVLCALFELDRDTMLADLGQAFTKIQPEDLQALQAVLQQAQAHPGPLHWKGRIRTHDGQLRWLESQGTPHHSNNGSTGYVGYIVDITEQISAQERIATTLQETQTARTDAERANSAKSLFLATMSHEMRTPLNAIIGLGDLLGFSPLDAEQQNHLAELKRASRMLLGIINDVLDLAKIEAGEFELSQERLHLSPLLDEVRRLSQVSASLKGLSLDVAPLAPELAQRVYLGDPLRLRQILLNLVSNAIKFTAQGGIRLSVSASPAASAERVRLCLAVSDTGIGIPADLLPQLFHPFVQADSGNTRRFGGTGLGLSVVRELAERMGGGVQVRSQPGQGSTFSVEIELAMLPETNSTEAHEPPAAEVDGRLRLEGVRLLLVDDSDMNLEVAGQLLRREGAEVETCSNGQQALDWLREHGEEVDVVLMDVQMPVMDGNTAVSHIRQDPPLARLPVIALTAGAMYSEREKSMQAGMSDYLTKPFERGQMVRLIRQHVQRYRGQPLPEGRLRPTQISQEVWPSMEGIALAQVQRRLNGDVALFIKLLQRLLDEFGDLSTAPDVPPSEATRKSLERRLHKLAGNAGLLGANTIYHLAKTAETALRAQELASVPAYLQQLAEQMAHLTRAAAPVLAQAQARTEPTAALQAAPLDLAELARLRTELHNHQLSAISRYQQMTDSLRQALSEADFRALDHAMNTLNFRAALAQLQAL